MQIDKSQILDMLRQQGKDDQVQQAEQELPDKVDPQEHGGLLSRFGIDPQDLVSRFAGGGGLGDLGGGLGGLTGGR